MASRRAARAAGLFAAISIAALIGGCLYLRWLWVTPEIVRALPGGWSIAQCHGGYLHFHAFSH